MLPISNSVIKLDLLNTLVFIKNEKKTRLQCQNINIPIHTRTFIFLFLALKDEYCSLFQFQALHTCASVLVSSTRDLHVKSCCTKLKNWKYSHFWYLNDHRVHTQFTSPLGIYSAHITTYRTLEQFMLLIVCFKYIYNTFKYWNSNYENIAMQRWFVTSKFSYYRIIFVAEPWLNLVIVYSLVSTMNKKPSPYNVLFIFLLPV